MREIERMKDEVRENCLRQIKRKCVLCFLLLALIKFYTIVFDQLGCVIQRTIDYGHRVQSFMVGDRCSSAFR